MTQWWRVSYWSTDRPNVLFMPLDVVKETDSFLMHLPLQKGKPQRTAKVNEYAQWFRSKREALEHLIDVSIRKEEAALKTAASLRKKVIDLTAALAELPLEDEHTATPAGSRKVAPASAGEDCGGSAVGRAEGSEVSE